MNNLNYQQKIAIMRILLDIIHADGRIDNREVFYFNKLREEFDLDDDSKEDVEKKNSLIALAQIKSFDEEQKLYFSELMNKMIVIDEDVNVNEVIIYDVVCEFSNIKRDFIGI